MIYFECIKMYTNNQHNCINRNYFHVIKFKFCGAVFFHSARAAKKASPRAKIAESASLARIGGIVGRPRGEIWTALSREIVAEFQPARIGHVFRQRWTSCSNNHFTNLGTPDERETPIWVKMLVKPLDLVELK